MNRQNLSCLCLLSFDVEDWFHVENLKGVIRTRDWPGKEQRVVGNTQRLLFILDKYSTKATFFVLGWVAEREPQLVKEIHRRGHEIASHGCGHELIYNISDRRFRQDVRKSKAILEDMVGEGVLGYRAPSFSITDRAIDILREEDFRYDSSVFPVLAHDRYGKLASVGPNERGAIQEIRQGFYEVTVSTFDIGNKGIPWGGGGYFRTIPYAIYRIGVQRILRRQNAFVFYLHPWEIDPGQPRVVEKLGMAFRIRHYAGLRSAECKLDRLVGDFRFGTIRDSLRVLGCL